MVTSYHDLRLAAEKALGYVCNVNTAEADDVIRQLCAALELDEHYRADELAAPLLKPIRVIAFVEGGVVQAARASAPVDFVLMDADAWEAGNLTLDEWDDLEDAYADLPFGVL